jgi:hypothetical protein
MIDHAKFMRIYRMSAWYDVVVSAPYATPPTLFWMFAMVDALHTSVGLPQLPELTTLGILFANFFGTVVAIWSVVRLRSNDPRLARFDAAGRWLFALWMFVALEHGATPVLWVFVAIELGFAVLQSLPLRRSPN